MEGLTITTDFEDGVIDGMGMAYPKVISLSTSLKVIHQHSLGWDNDTKDWLGMSEGALGFPYNAEPYAGESAPPEETPPPPPDDDASPPGTPTT